MKIIDEKLLSDTIRFLRFPLIVGVVLIHSQIPGEWMERVTENPWVDFPVYSTVSYLFASIIARTAVPLFFFISGFLFFHKTSFNFSIYIQKLCKRCRTLLIPYLLWNLIAVAITAALHYFLTDYVTAGPESNYSVRDYIQSFWNFKQFHHNTPINDPLWFVRDLMVVIVASPLIYLLIKYSKIYGIMGLGALWFLDWWIGTPGFSLTALFFFSTGAYFSIQRSNFVEVFAPFRRSALGLYVLSAILQFCFRECDVSSYISKANILAGIVLATSVSSWLLSKERWMVNPFLSEVSFFIYVYHGLFVYRLTSRAFMVLPHTDFSVLLIYLICPVVIFGIGMPLYAVLKKLLPKTTAVLMGGR